MDRLKIVLLTAALLTSARVSAAQQRQDGSLLQPTSTDTSNFTVVGDVQDPRTFAYAAQSRLTVREAVLQARPAGNLLSVSVVRKSQDQANWTQLISRESADTGELVASGDVMVVQSLQALPTVIQKNAAVRSDAGVVVVTLENDAVAIGDVLQQTIGLPATDHQVAISCRFQGRPAATRTTLSSAVSHGDVVTVRAKNQKVLSGFGKMAPAVSEWIPEPEVLLSPTPLAAELNSVVNTVSDTASGIDEETHIKVLAEPAEPLFNTWETGDSKTSEDNPLFVPIQDVSQSSVKESPIAVDDTKVAVEAAPVPPTPQVDAATAGVESSGWSFWNMAVITGLLVAAFLLLAGSLGDDEDNTVIEKDATSKKTIASTPSMFGKRTNHNSERIESVSNEVKTFSTAITVAAPLETEIRSTPVERTAAISSNGGGNVNSQVMAGEWFGKDWSPKVEQPTLGRNESHNAVQPVTSAEKAAMTDTATPRALRDNKIDDAEVDRLENLVRSVAQEGRKRTQPATEKPVTASSDFSDLEDLLQNRLPVDLCEAQLPLRISLFGHPAGPRRLRVDAAHTTFSGPHTHLSTERRQEDRVPLTSRTESGSVQSSSTDDGLDRALNSIQDRTNS